MAWNEIDIREVKESLIQLISNDWALVTAGDKAAHNTMTVSWGGAGELWGKDVTFIFIRPQRHTLGFIENSSHYSLCFFDETHRDALKLCGAKSGRDCDKDKEAGITPCFDQEAPYYAEAKLAIICKKMAAQDITPTSFLTPKIEQWYPEKDYHRMFIGEIEKVLVKA